MMMKIKMMMDEKMEMMKIIITIIRTYHSVCMGWDSSVSTATRYGLDGPWIESRWGARFSAPVQIGHGAHPPPIQWITGLSRV
jgi:hypothetical protein